MQAWGEVGVAREVGVAGEDGLQRGRALVGDVGELHVLVGHAARAPLVRELEHLPLVVPARRHEPEQLRPSRQRAAVGAERLSRAGAGLGT